MELVNQVKPKKDYYKQSLGDKLLFLERVDGIHYDILDEERRKRAIIQERKLERAREEKNSALYV